MAARDIATGVVHLQRPDGSFGAPDGGQVFSPSVDVATADVDGDGDVDVAAAVTADVAGGNDIQVRLNDGTGDLSPGQTIDAGGTGPRALVAGDLNDDDDGDLAWLVGQGQFGRVATALGNGDGTFGGPVLREIRRAAITSSWVTQTTTVTSTRSWATRASAVRAPTATTCQSVSTTGRAASTLTRYWFRS